MCRSPFQVLILLGFLLLIVGCGSSAPSTGTITGCATLSPSSVPSAGGSATSTPNGTPSGIPTGPDGALWFTESGDFAQGGNKIGCITTKGTITEFTLPSS